MFDCDKLRKQHINPLTGRKIDPSKATYKKLLETHCSGANKPLSEKDKKPKLTKPKAIKKINKNDARKEAFLKALIELPIGLVRHIIDTIDDPKFKTIYASYLKHYEAILDFMQQVHPDSIITNSIIVALFLRIEPFINKINDDAVRESLMDEAYKDVVVLLSFGTRGKRVLASKYEVHVHNLDGIIKNKKIKMEIDKNGDLVVVSPIDKSYRFFSDVEYEFIIGDQLPESNDDYIIPRFYEYIAFQM